MDETETLSLEQIQEICYLCMRKSDNLIDVNDTTSTADSTSVAVPVILQQLYSIRLPKSDKVESKVCEQCLSYSKEFFDYRTKVQKCQSRICSYLQSIGIDVNYTDLVNSVMPNNVNLIATSLRDSMGGKALETVPDENSVVMVVDPSKFYESSEDESNESDMEDTNSPVIEPPSQPLNNELPITHPDADYPVARNHVANEPTDSYKNISFCQYCDMAFASPMECLSHEVVLHGTHQPHHCTSCVYRAETRQNLMAHIRETHDAEKPYACVSCVKRFGRRSDLKKHSIVHTGVRPYACHLCNKSFSRNTNLSKHMRTHTGARPHQCSTCRRSYATPEELIEHSKVHAGQKQFACQKCPATFSRRDKLANHVRSRHPNETPGEFNPNNLTMGFDAYSNSPSKISETYFSCTVCRKRCPTPAALEEHMEGHYHVCQVCFKKFLRKRELERHSAIHTGMKSFECRICYKKFSRKDKLVRHERTHSMEKQFPCNYCHLIFTRRDALFHHLKSHADIPAQSVDNLTGGYACTECEITYVTMTELVQHMQTVHATGLPIDPNCTEDLSKNAHLINQNNQTALNFYVPIEQNLNANRNE